MIATQYEGKKTFSIIEKKMEAPANGEVRIKVAYVGVCGTDVHIYHGMMDQPVGLPLTAIQQIFEGIDTNPDGMKVLMACWGRIRSIISINKNSWF